MKFRRVILLAVIAFGSCLLSQAQIARSGERPTESGGLRMAELLQLPTYRAPQFDQDSARLEMEQSSADLRAYLFAHTIEVGLDIIQDGEHTQWSDGTEVWRYRVRSQGAKSLGFFFDQWKLPRGAYLYIYSTLDPTRCLGGFGWENNNERASLPIQPILADDVVIELQAPKGSRPRLHLQELYHGVRSIEGLLRYSNPQVGSPRNLACTPEVACYPEYQDVARSVVVVVTGSGYLGTGVLVNNTSSDGRPLILTASHVMEANFSNGILSPQRLEEEAEKSVFFFNYQTPMCDSGIQPSTTQSIAGAKMLGCHPFTDVALLELNVVAPPADYQAYYAGWNAEPKMDVAHANIHHPYGYTKRINLALSPLNYSTYSGSGLPFGENQHIKVPFWDLGTTASGSSGSPLLDPEHRITGVLSGGESYCGNRSHDFFASLQRVWESEDAEARKIVAALDPTGAKATTCAGKGASQGGEQAPVRLTNMRIAPSNTRVIELLPQLDRAKLLGGDQGVQEIGESYRMAAGSKVYGVYVMLSGEAQSGDELVANIYGNDGDTHLGSQVISLKSLVTDPKNKGQQVPGAFKEIYLSLPSPVEVTTDQVLCFAIPTATIPQGISVVHQQHSDLSANSAMWRVANEWQPYTKYQQNGGLTLWVDPVVSNATLKSPTLAEPRLKITPLNGEQMLLKINDPSGSATYSLQAYSLLGEPIYSDQCEGSDFFVFPRNMFEGLGVVILRVSGDGWQESVKALFPKN